MKLWKKIMYKKVITMTAAFRPGYTSEVIDSLSQCYGIKDYLLIICIDRLGGESNSPANADVIECINNISFCEKVIIENPHKLDCSRNTQQALSLGFDETDFNIHIEDDTVPSRDALKYFEWCEKEFRNRDDIFTVSGYSGKLDDSHRMKKRPEQCMGLALKNDWFTGWGWATWKDRWEHINNVWDKHGGGWDVSLNKERKILSKKEIIPVLSRFNNIGAEGGRHTPNALWHYDNQWNFNNFAGNGYYDEHFNESLEFILV